MWSRLMPDRPEKISRSIVLWFGTDWKKCAWLADTLARTAPYPKLWVRSVLFSEPHITGQVWYVLTVLPTCFDRKD